MTTNCDHSKGLQLTFGNAAIEWCPECGALAIPSGMGQTISAVNSALSRNDYRKGQYAFIEGMGSCRRYLPKRLSESR